MSTKFTEGPWISCGYRVQVEHEIGYSPIAECGFSDDFSDDKEIANAQLIATAPEMYEMLNHTMVELFNTINVYNDLADEFDNVDKINSDTIDKIQNLLAKARGEI